MEYQIYTMYVNGKDLLVQAIRSLGPHQHRVVVLDNSPEQNLTLRDFPGEIVTPSVPLFCNQSYNLMQRLAEARGQEVYFIMHSDARATPEIVDALLDRAAELNAQGRRWGVLFTNYDVLCLMNTPLLRSIHWDRFLPLYYTDVDYYYRLKLLGLELIETYLPVEHLNGGSSTHSDPEVKTFVDANYPAWRHYYIQKWGGDRGQEQYKVPFGPQAIKQPQSEATESRPSVEIPQPSPSDTSNTPVSPGLHTVTSYRHVLLSGKVEEPLSPSPTTHYPGAGVLFERALEAPSDIREHLPYLFRLASTVDHVTELGTRTGQSTIALMCARPKRIVAYDIQAQPSIPDLEAAARELKVDFQFLEQDVLQADIEPTDLLFIDTWHVESQASAELQRHADKARRYLVFHDTETYGFTGETPGHRGIWFAIANFMKRNPQWTLLEHFPNNNGLTVLMHR